MRYADDVNIYVKTMKAAERVTESSVRFLEGKRMKLKVNEEKSSVGSPTDIKFLGFRLRNRGKGTAGITVHDRSVKKFKDRIRQITKRNRARSTEQIISELRTYERGWMNYFGLSEGKDRFVKLDSWVRRKVRTLIFKKGKRSFNRYRNLRKTAQSTKPAAVSEHGDNDTLEGCQDTKPWRASGEMSKLIPNKYMRDELGMYFMADDWDKVQQRCSNRPLPNGTMGGVRGRLA